MKTFLPLTFFVFISSISFGQITMTVDDLPSVGDSLYRNTTEKIDKSFFPSTDAPNAVWDLSWLTGDSPELVRYSDPKEHELKDSLKDANIVQHSSPVDFFVKKDASGFNALGAIADPDAFPDDPVVLFQNPVNLLPTPFTLKDENETQGAVTFYYDSDPLYVELYFDISRDLEVVNYGQIKMNDGKTYDVLMVDLFERQITATVTSFSPGDTSRSNDDSKIYYYEFYTKGYGIPLVRAERDSLTDSIISIEYLDTKLFVGDKEPLNLQDLTVFPNPSQDVFNVDLPEGAHQIEVFNAAGQQVHSDAVNTSRYQLDGLKPGVYMVRVYDRKHSLLGQSRLIAE